MKKYIGFGLAIVMTAVLAMPVSRAAEEAAEAMPTQADLARLLVNVLGLSVDLPATPSDVEVFSALLANQIAPAEGWQSTNLVTRADLARVVVQAMGEADQVENPDDAQSWVDYLKGLGVPIDTVGQAVAGVTPLNDPVTGAGLGGTDPLETPGANPGTVVFGTPVDDPSAQDVNNPLPSVAVVTALSQIKDVIKEVTRPPSVTKKPVTPN